MTPGSSADWEARIRNAWRDATAPGKRVVRGFVNPESPRSMSDGDGRDAQDWLAGKHWDEIASDWKIDVEPALHYLTGEACGYFLGGYLLELSQGLDSGCSGDYTPLHFSLFLGSERFGEIIHQLSEEQRSVLFHFVQVMIGNRQIFNLEDRYIESLQKAAALL